MRLGRTDYLLNKHWNFAVKFFNLFAGPLFTGLIKIVTK